VTEIRCVALRLVEHFFANFYGNSGMAGTPPILLVLIPTIIGAAWMAVAFGRRSRTVALGALIGAAGGAAGALLFMAPLNFCPFEPERSPLDSALGLGLIALGMVVVMAPLWYFIRWRWGGIALSSAVHHYGIFRAAWYTPWLLLLPTLIILVLFLYYPSLENFRLSTLLYRLGAPRSAFVCLDNFTLLLEDPQYGYTVWISFAISFGIIILGLSLSLLIATMAYQPIRGARIYRTLLVWPYAISPPVAGIIFFFLFHPLIGVINYILSTIFGVRTPWLNDPSIAPLTIILASVWKTMGFNILFYIAGLQNVSSDLLEAASIDGANAIKRFFRITLPLLSPITFFLIITNMTYSFFDTFGTIDYLTGGGPSEATTTMIYNIYKVGIQNRDLGKAAAQSIVLFVMVVGLTVLQFRTAGRRVSYGA
jgi:sn-glycerol 3-phosphate transport system permease protein